MTALPRGDRPAPGAPANDITRELTAKRPATVVRPLAVDDGRGADGHRRAVHGGISGAAMFRFCLLALVFFLFTGLLLALITPTR